MECFLQPRHTNILPCVCVLVVCPGVPQVPQVSSSQEVVLIPSYWYLSLNGDINQHMDLQQAGLLMYR